MEKNITADTVNRTTSEEVAFSIKNLDGESFVYLVTNFIDFEA
ncbi:hypothetical protein FFONT_0004 [Fervidicoccus fontis Kam940]|uniref:Uncharacterized protein n=1 Tax=Fervidicoccus fontis (strain DSM 19380 / JCM 18336 / VKM B-2539 / Kam940) TaxID=1163730 RepID=H9ZZ43_FERFK|nr:hypothetical protein FFONT_0004 [Fervidicoccus fontis Kam940]